MAKKPRLDRQIGAVLRGILIGPFAGLLAICGVRFALISNPGRIGHMVAEMDNFLKEQELELTPRVRPILLLERKRAGNKALLDVFRQYVTVWDKRWQKLLFTPFTKFGALRLPLGRPILGFGESARYAQTTWLWRDRPPAIELPSDMDARGKAKLAEMGVPEGAWFVCAHAREGGYSPRDEHDHKHRNADISTYEMAFDEIIARGGWVIRVGDSTMTPMPARDGVIDYALSSHKSEWMDLWLCTRNRFFLGTTSGLIMLPTMAGKQSVLVNMIPHGAALGMAPGDISIPKRFMRDGTEMTLPQIFDGNLSVQRYASVFDDHGVEIVNNTPEEIRDVTVEMLDRLDGTYAESETDRDLQRRFRALLRPVDYCYGATSRIGRDWLRANEHLL